MKAPMTIEIIFTLELVKPTNWWIRRINKECQPVMAEAGAEKSESGLESKSWLWIVA